MTGTTWQRLGGIAGIVFVALFVTDLFTPGTPDLSDPTAGLAAQIADERGGHMLSVYLSSLGVMAFLVFLGALWSVLRRAEGEAGASIVAVLGGVVLAAMILVGNGIYLALVEAADEAREPVAIRALLELDGALFIPAGFALGLLYAGIALSSISTGSLPRWLGWSAAGFAAVFVVALLGVFSRDDEGGPLGIVFFLALMLQFLWVLAASIVLMGATRTDPQRARHAVAA